MLKEKKKKKKKKKVSDIIFFFFLKKVYILFHAKNRWGKKGEKDRVYKKKVSAI